MGTIIPLADFELEAVDGVPVAHLSGEIDRTNSAELGERMADAIKNGIPPDFNMVPFKDKLKDEEIWNVVNYLRSIAKKR